MRPPDFLSSGRDVAESFVRALDVVLGRRLQDYARILDFGSGCGRVLRWLIPKAASSHWHACDIDAPAIDWISKNIPSVDAVQSEPLPRLPFNDRTFDLVLGYSVFTHFPENYQDAWLQELQRVTRPDGTVLLTVHGPNAYKDAATRSAFTVEHADQFQTQGYAYWANDFWKDHFPAYYQTAYHHHDYVRKRWSQWLDIKDILEVGAPPRHDIVVATRERRPKIGSSRSRV